MSTRVRHRDTLIEGSAVSTVSRLGAYDNKGPWFVVFFDDGLQCHVPTSEVEIWTVFGWM